MNIAFKTLFTVGVQHHYYDSGACEDFDFVTPSETAERLRGHRCIARVVEHVLHVLCEVDSAGAPLADLEGETLTFGLRLVNPNFGNVTVPPLGDTKLIP